MRRRGLELFEIVPQGNAAVGYAANDPAAPYQQKWFPVMHGSVGGGGVRGLSDCALDWILDGAREMGLELDLDPA